MSFRASSSNDDDDGEVKNDERRYPREVKVEVLSGSVMFVLWERADDEHRGCGSLTARRVFRSC